MADGPMTFLVRESESPNKHPRAGSGRLSLFGSRYYDGSSSSGENMSHEYILALDQGTTSSRAILFNRDGQAVNVAQQEFEQLYPKPGWVEHRPRDIWSSQLAVARRVLEDSGVKPDQIAAIGLTNQRETTLIWDRESHE